MVALQDSKLQAAIDTGEAGAVLKLFGRNVNSAAVAFFDTFVKTFRALPIAAPLSLRASLLVGALLILLDSGHRAVLSALDAPAVATSVVAALQLYWGAGGTAPDAATGHGARPLSAPSGADIGSKTKQEVRERIGFLYGIFEALEHDGASLLLV